MTLVLMMLLVGVAACGSRPDSVTPSASKATALERSVAPAVATVPPDPLVVTSAQIPGAHADLDACRADPAAWCARDDATRLGHVATPSATVTALRASGPSGFTAKPGASVLLQVQAVPQVPVTFVSHGLGAFANNRTAVTVISDASGVANVSFTITPGTVGVVDISASSPATSGLVGFVIQVSAASGELP